MRVAAVQLSRNIMKRFKKNLILCVPSAMLLMAIGPTAQAGGWGDFSTAFPAYPCNDGWIACRVDGETISPEMRPDDKGLPIPSDMRLNWSNLEPTKVFSPFVSLSVYTGELPDAVAEAEPEPDPEPQTRPTPASSGNDGGGSGGGNNDGGGSGDVGGGNDGGGNDGGGRGQTNDGGGGDVVPEPSPEPQAASESGGSGSVRPQDGGSGSVRPKDGGSSEPEPAPSSVRPQSVPAPAPETIDVTKQAAPPTMDDSCDDLVKLEPPAMLGKLGDGQVACLEASYAAAARQTEKDKVSRLLMVNSYSKGDTKNWEKLVKRHLEEVDQSDPDICYRYAIYLNKKRMANGAIRWADVALENKTLWTGDTYTSRVYSLHKIKAASAQQLWKKAEEKNAASPSDESKADVEKTRGNTKVFAREWYDYAKSAGKDTTKALQLCVSAAGTRDYCEAG